MQQTKLSVIVCTYNREEYIGECLTHLTNQTLDKEKYEVLVINNNSTDNTEIIIQDFIIKHANTPFRYIIEKKQGLAFARNRGIFESNGEILSFIDDDAFVSKDYCSSIIDFFERRNDVAAIGGRIIPAYESKEPEWMSRYLLPLVAALDKGDKEIAFTGGSFPIGANMAFRKTIFDEYGIFDVELGRRGGGLEGGEEKDVFIRLKKGHEKIYFVPGVSVRHVIPPHRVDISYVKGLAIGVGTSEKKRIQKSGLKEVLNKLVSESIKTIATLVLAISYLLRAKHPSKALMLIRFRYWVIFSLISK